MISYPSPALLLGLIGSGIQGSLSPYMHEKEASEQGLRCIYKLIDIEALNLGVEKLSELLTAAQRLGFNGLNITHPFKQSIIPLLDELSDDAASINAVNTVILKDGQRIGYNTDWWGFAESFRRNLPDVKREHVVQLGAGGAGAAVAHATLTLGVGELSIFDIDNERAERLVSDLAERFGLNRVNVGRDLHPAVAEADGLINTTPIGMTKYPGLPLPAELLHSALWVAEIVYFPLETELLKRAREMGCRIMNGGGMAVFQAVEAFRLFSGITPNAERILNHFNSMISVSS